MGWCKYYNAGIFEQVVANRDINTHTVCPECIGYVALEHQYYGQRVWLDRIGYEPEGPFLAIDTAPVDAVITNGWVADVDWRTAQRWHMAGPVWVKVTFEKPWRAHYEGVE